MYYHTHVHIYIPTEFPTEFNEYIIVYMIVLPTDGMEVHKQYMSRHS
jgi:hypothetical protein